MKPFLVLVVCAFCVAARAEDGKQGGRAPAKMGLEARIYVVDKEAPSGDKRERLQPPPLATKEK